MSVDIKTLRIGCHVQHHGKRKIVHCIGGDMVCLLPSIVSSVAHVAKTNEIEPIPITHELLRELGFEDCSKKQWHTEDYEKRWKGQYLSFTELHSGWLVYYFDGTKAKGKTVVRHLHEAEAFLALHGVELIKD